MAFFGLFGSKCPIEAHEWEWMLASLRWLDEEFADGEKSAAGPLILPTAEFFAEVPDAERQSLTHRDAEYLFGQVKRNADMADWPTQLIPVPELQHQTILAPEVSGAMRWNDALGTFRLAQEPEGQVYAEIQYSPDQINRPANFIATMAHELSHYLMSQARTCPPGGWDCHELTTDLTAVWMGFGIFMANSAKHFESGNQGWSSGAAGYLSEKALVTALALCAQKSGYDPADAMPYLKPYLVADLKKADAYVQSCDPLAQMQGINMDDYGVVPNESLETAN